MFKTLAKQTQGTYNNSATKVKQLKIITEVDVGQHLNDHIHTLSTGSILNTGDQLTKCHLYFFVITNYWYIKYIHDKVRLDCAMCDLHYHSKVQKVFQKRLFFKKFLIYSARMH